MAGAIHQTLMLGLHTGLVGAIIAKKIVGRKSTLGGSGIGGVRATQEVIDLCAAHNIRHRITFVHFSAHPEPILFTGLANLARSVIGCQSIQVAIVQMHVDDVESSQCTHTYC